MLSTYKIKFFIGMSVFLTCFLYSYYTVNASVSITDYRIGIASTTLCNSTYPNSSCYAFKRNPASYYFIKVLSSTSTTVDSWSTSPAYTDWLLPTKANNLDKYGNGWYQLKLAEYPATTFEIVGYFYYLDGSVVDWRITNSSIFPTDNPNITQIIYFDPDIATSTGTSTISMSYRLSSNDIAILRDNTGGSLRVGMQLLDNSRGISYPLFDQVYDYNEYLALSLTIATSSFNLKDGLYTIYGNLIVSDWWNLFGPTTVVSTSTKIQVGTTTSYSSYFQEFNDSVTNLLSSTTQQLGDYCSPFTSSFDMGSCLVMIFVPDANIWYEDLNLLKKQAPWGYAFRFYDIVSGNATSATSSMPSISYTFATSSIFSNIITDIHFDPFATLQETGSIVNTVSDQGGNKDVWDIMMPYIRIIVYLMLGFMIIKELTGLHIHDKDSHY